MEWVLGITDQHPSKWKRKEPEWKDEVLKADSQHSFQELMTKLCETALAKRRSDGDHGINAHLWNLEICSEADIFRLLDPMRLQVPSGLSGYYDDSSSSGSDSDSDEDSTSHANTSRTACSCTKIMPSEEFQQQMKHGTLDLDEKENCQYKYLASRCKLSLKVLPEGHIMKVSYDYGDTTTLYCKALSVKPRAVACLMEYFEADAKAVAQAADIKKVPAYTWPKEQQLDAYYPHFSQAALGYYVPLYQQSTSGTNKTRRAMRGATTLGLSAKVRNEMDTQFSTIEDASGNQDLMFAGLVFEDLNEFLEVAEQAWTPRQFEDKMQDPDELYKYNYDWIKRHVYPQKAAADDIYAQCLEENESEWAAYGPKRLFFRLPVAKQQAKPSKADTNVGGRSALSQHQFDFYKAFPKTAAHFASGKFRWLEYKRGVLRVLVGRGTGEYHRDYESGQVLRMWKRKFESFHELLCAVEASWIYDGKPLEPDMELSYHDADLGPSHPGPTEPKCYGNASQAAVLHRPEKPKGHSKFVTAIAIVEEGAQTILYSGHADGTLSKWALHDNDEYDKNSNASITVLLWSKQIYHNATEDRSDDLRYMSCIGVRGIAVRWDPHKKIHRVYTWTGMYEGYPQVNFDEREPSQIKCWSGRDSRLLKTYSCNVGFDEDGDPAHPSIAAVVFCQLYQEPFWVDAMVVGMHCLCQPLECEKDCSDFDLEEEQENGQGNILPFFEHSGRAMSTWRGHGGMIEAMAVIPDKYLVSYSMRHGHGFPDALILWDLENPGVPLYRHDFWNPRRSLYKQNKTRLHGVSGISVCGNDILISCDYGDSIAVVTVEEFSGGMMDIPRLKLQGYGTLGNVDSEAMYPCFYGRMAMSGQYAVMANEYHGDAWLFQIEGNASHEKLDRREGNRRDFLYDDDEELAHFKFSGRDLSIGKASFPKFGGCVPKRKKHKPFDFSFSSDSIRSSREEDKVLGEGGPVALAFCGKWLVAGFSNGALVRAPFLADLVGSTGKDPSYKEYNCLASYSGLPSDEWNCPILEAEE